MSMKLKALGLGLLAAMAMSAIVVVNASALPSGHFTSANSHTVIAGTEGGTHQVKLQVGEGNTVECKKATYSGTAGLTATELTITPSYSECQTTGGTANEVTVTMNGCDYVFSSQGTRTHGTATVTCGANKKIEVHHPNCTISIGSQHSLGGGVDYDADGSGLTANVTVTNIAVQYHSGLCVFLGTNQVGKMTGSVTLAGQTTAGGAVAIAST